jgi:hypothetical protein
MGVEQQIILISNVAGGNNENSKGLLGDFAGIIPLVRMWNVLDAKRKVGTERSPTKSG